MKKIVCLLLAVLTMLGLCACGGSAKETAAYDSAPREPAAMAEEAVEMEMAYANGSQSYSVGTTDSSASDTVVNRSFDSEKIIYSCYAEIETLTFEESCQEITKLIARYGGFLEKSTVSGHNYNYEGRRNAEYVIRIPRESFEEVTGSLSNIGNVPYCSISAENITSQYRDTESRLATYQVEEERLLAMLEKAETVADMLEIESRLAEVRYEIESLTTTILGWDSLVSYSTLTIYLQEVIEYTAEPELTYWQRIGKGFMRTLRDVGEFFKDLLRVFIVSLPVLVLLGAVAVIVVVIVRFQKKRRAAKKAWKQDME